MKINVLGAEYSVTVSNETKEPLAHNEELVDWIAIQGPKLYKAWQEAGAV